MQVNVEYDPLTAVDCNSHPETCEFESMDIWALVLLSHHKPLNAVGSVQPDSESTNETRCKMLKHIQHNEKIMSHFYLHIVKIILIFNYVFKLFILKNECYKIVSK